ncbi:hypothetical protein A4D02_30730 [Niastella koreensis]|uniref:BRCT domain-containing protein n=1 Tax=Niastella koreensis TaxID=354356 RepID=A0ABX3NUZ3_9BACT|nr:hypothetical protein A4D02_30730 [Niastella koreensis]
MHLQFFTRKFLSHGKAKKDRRTNEHPAKNNPSANGTMIYINASPSIDTVMNKVEQAGGKIIGSIAYYLRFP